MYINFETIIQVGKVLGALVLIGGILISIYKWYSRQNEQDIEIKKSYAVGRTGTVSVASGQQGPDGNICMMGTTVKLAANDEISLSGTWLTGDKLTS